MNIERRSFLRMLGLTPTLGMMEHASIKPNNEATEYRGWTIKWTDWMPVFNQRVLVGHWVAVKEGNPFGVYSSVPGGLYWFLPGQLFDTSVYEQEGQMYITPETTVKAAENQKNLGLTRLLKFLDNPPPMPGYWSNYGK
jgi:hypothetical protein